MASPFTVRAYSARGSMTYEKRHATQAAVDADIDRITKIRYEARGTSAFTSGVGGAARVTVTGGGAKSRTIAMLNPDIPGGGSSIRRADRIAGDPNNGMARQFSAKEVRAAQAIFASGGPGADALQRSLAGQMRRSLRGT